MPNRRHVPFWPGKHRSRKAEDTVKTAIEPRDLYDWITLGIAAVGVLIIAASTVITAYQAALTRETIDHAASQERAWLRVELSADSKLTIDETGADLFLTASVTNVGNLPAQGVEVDALFVPFNFDQVNPLVRASRRQCIGPVISGVGHTVFPGETLKIRTFVSV